MLREVEKADEVEKDGRKDESGGVETNEEWKLRDSGGGE